MVLSHQCFTSKYMLFNQALHVFIMTLMTMFSAQCFTSKVALHVFTMTLMCYKTNVFCSVTP